MLSFSKDELNSLFRYAISLTQKEEWAYDLVSHGVEKILARPFVLNKKSYAKKCIRNKFFDETKRQKLEAGNVTEVISLKDLEKSTIEKDLVEKLMGKLNPEERELLYLWAVEDYTLLEISKQTNTSRGTLTSRLSRLKKKLHHFQEYKQ